MYDFPVCLTASSKFDKVRTCNTSFAPVLVLFVCVAVPNDFVIISVTSVLSTNTLMSFTDNELVTSLMYSSLATSVFVVPLNVMFSFGLFASAVSVCTLSFIHSVLYFGLMVPFVNSIVVLESVFNLKFVLS